MSLGNRIKEFRQGKKMSQEKVAELVGVSRQAVTKWEADQTAPSTENLFKLADIFGTTVDMLIASDERTTQSTAEQVYYLYKMEEEKKDEQLRTKQKKNIHLALVVAAGYLVIFLLGRIICGGGERTSVLGWLFGTDPSQSSYLFGWLLSSNMYLIASIISIIPVFFGKYKFSIATLCAFLIGLILGELLGPNPRVPAYGISHYGWQIWGGIFLFSMVIGVILEKIMKPGVSLKSKKVWIGASTAIIAAIFVIAIIYSAIPKYPQPEYPVSTYEELLSEFATETQYVVPPENLLPEASGKYFVELKSRFSNEKIGYLISFEPIEGEYGFFEISCKLISTLPNEQLDFQQTEEYNGVGLSVTERHICFVWNSCRYDIYFANASAETCERAMSITQSIIDTPK